MISIASSATALAYFHKALLLQTSGDTPWEFLGEALLNWNKSLEALFTTGATDSDGRPQTHNEAREGLAGLGYSENEVAHFITVMKLRDEFDVGHVNIWPHAGEHVSALNDYLINVEPLFRDLFRRLFDLLQSGDYELLPDESLPRWSNTAKTLEYIATRLCAPPVQQPTIHLQHNRRTGA